MNRIIIVGNGFDLAHGRKTSYDDFMHFMLKAALTKSASYDSNEYDFPLWKINRKSFNRITDWINKQVSFADLLEKSKNYGYDINPKGSLFNIIFNDLKEMRWVDIESAYYSEMKRISIMPLYIRNKNIKELNTQFEILRSELIRYLNQIDPIETLSLEILSLFNSNLKNNYMISPINEILNQSIDNYLILDFNYTDTVNQYLNKLEKKRYKHIQIHGNLKDVKSIVFGYGDEVDSNYNDIENLNSNEFFKHIKSFNYLKDSKYIDMARFVESKEPFEVYVFGHSLGLSDRTLLNFIFESKNMLSLKFYYYKRTDGTTDFIEKSFEVSRHFKNKATMRLKIVPEDKCEALPQLKV